MCIGNNFYPLQPLNLLFEAHVVSDFVWHDKLIHFKLYSFTIFVSRLKVLLSLAFKFLLVKNLATQLTVWTVKSVVLFLPLSYRLCEAYSKNSLAKIHQAILINYLISNNPLNPLFIEQLLPIFSTA